GLAVERSWHLRDAYTVTGRYGNCSIAGLGCLSLGAAIRVTVEPPLPRTCTWNCVSCAGVRGAGTVHPSSVRQTGIGHLHHIAGDLPRARREGDAMQPGGSAWTGPSLTCTADGLDPWSALTPQHKASPPDKVPIPRCPDIWFT